VKRRGGRHWRFGGGWSVMKKPRVNVSEGGRQVDDKLVTTHDEVYAYTNFIVKSLDGGWNRTSKLPVYAEGTAIVTDHSLVRNSKRKCSGSEWSHTTPGGCSWAALDSGGPLHRQHARAGAENGRGQVVE
jgi:hypothetical protein